MRINEVISETTAGSVAGVASALGSGDPAASIYGPQKKKKTKMIKRPALKEKK